MTNTTELTEKQREALLIALEHGYYAVPRQSSLHDVADVMDLSGQAVSERLRRAMKKLAEQELDE